MQRLFLIALAIGALSPTAAHAKSVWLILIKEGRDFSLEKIEMKDWNACQNEGESWKLQGERYKFHCLRGK
tara:strand:+ start:581 stop:793 length:213 start_codon:yes stop_codon:yes gene_type:complete